jgi:excinuclease UvrABC nuclease subunit
MIHQYQGNYPYNKETVEGWNSTAIGVYFCGYTQRDGSLCCHYVGKAVGEGGIRGRLLQHLSESKWGDIIHFGYILCDTSTEATTFEAQEIERLKPKYNTLGK